MLLHDAAKNTVYDQLVTNVKGTPMQIWQSPYMFVFI